MNLKVYIPVNKSLPFDSVRLAFSSSTEKKIVTTPPFGKPVILLFLNPNSVNNYSATSKGVLLGQHTQPLLLDLNENFKIMAIHLKPFALKQLFNIDASQLTNKYIGINDIEIINALHGIVLKNINTEKQLIMEIDQYFDSVARHQVSYEVMAFIDYIQKNNTTSISAMVKQIGVTERSLERKFKAEVGLTPKKYLQITRVFQIVENLKEDADWQQIAYQYNYSDQAHFINEFKKYTHIAPGLYVRKGLTITQQLPPFSSFEI